MNLRKLYLTKNNCYKTGKKIKPVGILVHSTGANNPKLSRYIGPDDGQLGPASPSNWNQPKPDGREVCVHGFIGLLADGTVATYQTLPWDTRGWHAGGKANDTHIGFEICEDGLTDVGYFGKVYREAVELCAYLCREYGIAPSSVICHSEAYWLGIASNHADVMHWFPKHGKNMDSFRADVAALLRPVPDTAGVTALLDAMQTAGVDFEHKTWAAALTGQVEIPTVYKQMLITRTVDAALKRQDFDAAKMRAVLTAIIS